MKRALLLLVGLAACTPEVPQPKSSAAVPARPTLPQADDVPNPLVIGLLPVFDPQDMSERFAPLASYIGEKLQTVVVLEAPKTYAEAIQMSARGEVDVGQLSPLAYIEAKERNPSLHLLVTHIAQGSATYSGYLLGRRSLHIRGVEELKNRKLAFVNEWSASGFLYPAHFLVSQGVVPGRDFPFEFLGRHDAVMSALGTGQVAVGATFSGALRNAEQEGQNMEPLEIIAKTGRIPFDCWTTRGDLPEGVRQSLQSILLALSTRTAKGRRLLGPLRGINGFFVVDDSHYDQVRRVRNELQTKAPELMNMVRAAAEREERR